MTKKLTLGQIQKEVDIYSKKKSVPLNDNFHVNIFPNFAPTKIQQLITEILTDKAKAEKEGLEFDVSTTNWGYFNIIKHFTDLGIPDDIEGKLKVYLMLLETDYFADIIRAFPQESIDKVTNAINSVVQSLEEFTNMGEEEQQQVLGQFISDNREEIEQMIKEELGTEEE